MIWGQDERRGTVDIQIDTAPASDNRIQDNFFF